MLGVFFLFIVLSSVILLGCVWSPQSSVTILSPRYGSTVSSHHLTVLVRVSHFRISDAVNGSAGMPNGHLHFFMDRAPPTIAGEPAITQPGTYATSTNLSYTWRNVSAGRHLFSVELVNDDDTPLSPVAKDQVQVDVT